MSETRFMVTRKGERPPDDAFAVPPGAVAHLTNDEVCALSEAELLRLADEYRAREQ